MSAHQVIAIILDVGRFLVATAAGALGLSLIIAAVKDATHG
jgi:hypothetical protein